MCGIVGVLSKNNKNVVDGAICALKKLQHRGQDSAGIAFFDNAAIDSSFNCKLRVIKAKGLIKDALYGVKAESDIAIAHTRYTTSATTDLINAQPVAFEEASLAFNGTIANCAKYRDILIKNGLKIETDSDSEVLLKWLFYKIRKKPYEWKLEEIKTALADFSSGAYSIVLLLKDRLIALKDPFSYRPLVFIETKDEYYLLSEDCAINTPYLKKFELKGAIEIKKEGYRTLETTSKKTSQCVFEAVYFASSKSRVFDIDVKKTRMKLGEILAKNDSTEADCVVPIMKSGFWGALGYSKKRNIKLMPLIKNKQEILRTFIEKEPLRLDKIEEKFKIKKEVKGKKIIVVDDSIVRGTTAKKIVSLLKKSGAREIHLRLTSPMIINNCFWGVDMADKNELLAYNLKSIDNIKEALGVDSIKFISKYEFEKVFSKSKWCHKCFIATNNQE